MKSLSAKLAILVAVLLMASAIFLSSLAYFYMRSQAIEGLHREMGAITDQQSRMVGEWLASKRRIVEAAKGAAFDADPRVSMMRAKFAGEFGPVYIGFPDKRMLQADPNSPIPAGFDPTVRPWYKLALERDALATTNPFMSVSDNKLVVTITQPIKRDGALYGVMGANVILDELIQKVSSMKMIGDSYAFLVGKDGKVIAHRKSEAVLKPITDLLPEMSSDRLAALAASKDMGEMTNAGRRDYVIVDAVPGTDWYFGLVIDRAAALAPLSSMLYMLIGATVVVLLVANALVNFGMRRLLASLSALRDALLGIAQGEGDLTVRLPVTSEDEVGQAAGAFNNFLERLHGMFKEVREQARAVDKEVHSVAGTTSRVADDFSRQTEELTATAATIEQVTVSIGHIADTVRETESAMQTADTESARSAESVGQVTREITKIADTIGSLSIVVGRLGSRSNEIAGIVGAIKDIADQTNLLALNAAIEAARAGEQGRGFAVVADEVRKLAERTAGATVEIGGMIDSIRSEMKSALTGMDDAQQIVASGVGLAEQATSGIKQIRERVSDAVSRMHAISDATAEQASATTEMAKRAEQVNQMIQSSTESLRDADNALRTANGRVEQLGEIVGRFKL